MKAGQKKKVYSIEERLAHVEAFKASGKSLREYELTTGVKDQTLYNWVSGRNLKTQAKKAETKKAETKKPRGIARIEAAPPLPAQAHEEDEKVRRLWKEPLFPFAVGWIVITLVQAATAVANVATWFRR